MRPSHLMRSIGALVQTKAKYLLQFLIPISLSLVLLPCDIHYNFTVQWSEYFCCERKKLLDLMLMSKLTIKEIFNFTLSLSVWIGKFTLIFFCISFSKKLPRISTLNDFKQTKLLFFFNSLLKRNLSLLQVTAQRTNWTWRC